MYNLEPPEHCKECGTVIYYTVYQDQENNLYCEECYNKYNAKGNETDERNY